MNGGIHKFTEHSAKKLLLPCILFWMWCPGNLGVALHIFSLLNATSIGWLENPLRSWLYLCIPSMFGPSMYPDLLTLPDRSHNRPNGFQTCLGVIDFKMEASQSNLSKTQVEPQRLFWRLWEIFNLLQVKTIGQNQSKGTHIRAASPLGRWLWRSTATVYYNVIKSLRKEDGLAPCCLVEECLPDIPGLVENPQGYKESYKDMRKYSLNF